MKNEHQDKIYLQFSYVKLLMKFCSKKRNAESTFQVFSRNEPKNKRICFIFLSKLVSTPFVLTASFILAIQGTNSFVHRRFLTAILHRGLRNCFFLFYASFTFSNFYLDFYFPFSNWTLISHFLFGLLFPFFYLVFSFSIWVSIFLNFYFTPIAVTFWISSKFFI
jgi:hypothetical protein